MRLTIVPDDGTVIIDRVARNELDFSTCEVPAAVHALQWNEASGWIEFVESIDGTKPGNEHLDVLPSWANACYDVWQAADPIPPEPSVVVTVVSMRQARLALLNGGLLDAVDVAVAGASQADRITWEFATEVRRDDPLVVSIGGALGLTETDIDNLFAAAKEL